MNSNVRKSSFIKLSEKQKKNNEKMNVSLRICPHSRYETTDTQIIDLIKHNNIKIKKATDHLDIKDENLKKENVCLNYNFDNILNSKSTQLEVFHLTSKNVIDSMFEDYSGTIIVYGETGTGKSYSMLGESKDFQKGIIPRSFEYIFEKIKNDKKNRYNLFICNLQIYMEKIHDLIEPNNSVKIRDDGKPRIEGAQWVKVNSVSDVTAALNIAKLNKSELKIDSSNVHDIVVVKMEKSAISKSHKNENLIKTNLFFVDLAGSEEFRSSRSDSIDIKYDEINKINFGLSVFRDCYTHYDQNKKFITFSYKNSKLTRLLQDSINGNCFTSLLITISPFTKSYEETISSLIFGQKLMSNKINPIPNLIQDTNYEQINFKLRANLDDLNDQYAKLKISYDVIYNENIFLKQENFEIKKNNFKNNFDTDQVSALSKLYENQLRDLKNEMREKIYEMDRLIINKQNIINTHKIEKNDLIEENNNLNSLLKEAINEKDELIKTIIYLYKNSKFLSKQDIKIADNCISNTPNLNESVNLLHLLNKQTESVEAEIQTDFMISEDILINNLIGRCKNGKSIFDLMSTNNTNFKFEFFLTKFEKEVFRLNKEIKELKEKLKNKEDSTTKSLEFLHHNINYNEHNLNVSINSSDNLKIKSKSFKLKLNNSNFSKDASLILNSNWNDLIIDRLISLNYFVEDKIKGSSPDKVQTEIDVNYRQIDKVIFFDYFVDDEKKEKFIRSHISKNEIKLGSIGSVIDQNFSFDYLADFKIKDKAIKNLSNKNKNKFKFNDTLIDRIIFFHFLVDDKKDVQTYTGKGNIKLDLNERVIDKVIFFDFLQEDKTNYKKIMTYPTKQEFKFHNRYNQIDKVNFFDFLVEIKKDVHPDKENPYFNFNQSVIEKVVFFDFLPIDKNNEKNKETFPTKLEIKFQHNYNQIDRVNFFDYLFENKKDVQTYPHKRNIYFDFNKTEIDKVIFFDFLAEDKINDKNIIPFRTKQEIKFQSYYNQIDKVIFFDFLVEEKKDIQTNRCKGNIYYNFNKSIIDKVIYFDFLVQNKIYEKNILTCPTKTEISFNSKNLEINKLVSTLFYVGENIREKNLLLGSVKKEIKSDFDISASIDICTDKISERNSLLSSIKKELEFDDKNTKESGDTGADSKISELKNEIVKLKTTIFKKNKKLEEYENYIQNCKKKETQLLKQAKNDLNCIGNFMRESCRSIKISSRDNSQISGAQGWEREECNSIILNSIDNTLNLKIEYEQKIKGLNQTLEHLQTNFKSKEIQLELSKSTGESLKNKLVQLEKESNEVKEFYNYKLKRNTNKYKKMKKFFIEFQNFIENNFFYFESIIEYFKLFSQENKNKFISDLFKNDMDMKNIDIYNFSIFLYKINELNFILKLDDQINFDKIYFNLSTNNKFENNFKNSYNNFANKILKTYETILKTLITENTKIYYYINSINDLIKINVTNKFENKLLQKQINFQMEFFNLIKKKVTKESNEYKSLFNLENNLNEMMLTENKSIEEEKEKFDINFSEIIKSIQYKVFIINDENLFISNKNSEHYKTCNFYSSNKKFKHYFNFTKKFFLDIEQHIEKK